MKGKSSQEVTDESMESVLQSKEHPGRVVLKQYNSCSPRPCMSLAAANYSTTVCLYRCGRSRRGEYVPLPRRETEINIILVRRGHVCHWPRRTIAQRYGVPLWKITPRRSQYVAAASVKKN